MTSRDPREPLPRVAPEDDGAVGEESAALEEDAAREEPTDQRQEDRARSGGGRAGVWLPALAAAAVAACVALVVALVAMGGDDPAMPGDDSAEAGFTRDMAVHHQQAVEMSFIIRDRTDDKEVRTLAYDIANTQANQRGMMLGWLDIWGLTPTSGESPMAWMDGEHRHHKPHDGSLMSGMATNTQLEQLHEAEGRNAEVLFLRLMIEHHKGGVDMARGAVELSDNEQVERLAQGMVDSQESEIKLMNDMLRERGADPVG